MPTFAVGSCHVVSVTDPFGRVLGFLDRSLTLSYCSSVAELLFKVVKISVVVSCVAVMHILWQHFSNISRKSAADDERSSFLCISFNQLPEHMAL
jgi:hypothetical protein